MERTKVALLAAALLSVGGCASHLAPPERASRVVRPVVDPMPYAVAVHYPAQFRNATKLTPQMGGLVRFMGKVSRSDWNYPYGSNSVVLLDAAFASMFEKVIPLNQRPDGLLRRSDVAGTLVAETVAIHLRETPAAWLVKTTYTVSLYDASGALASSWQVSSREKLAGYDQLGPTIHAAMIEAVAKLGSTILDEKHKFKEWLAPAGAR